MLPNEAFHVTALFEVGPATVAVNVSLPFTIDEAEAGEMVIEVTGGSGGTGVGVVVITFTVAEADIVGSALLIAVTVALPAFAGAV
jgi:hypothetical protein